MKRLLLLPACLVMLHASAQETPATDAPAAEAVTVITSDKLIFDYKQSFADFEGNVKVDDPGLDLTCDRMTVAFNKDDDVEKIVAKGSVYIVQDDFEALSEVATYDVQDGNIKLEVNPQVQKGKDILQGGTIIYNRFSEKLEALDGAKLLLYKKEGKADVIPGFKPGRP